MKPTENINFVEPGEIRAWSTTDYIRLEHSRCEAGMVVLRVGVHQARAPRILALRVRCERCGREAEVKFCIGTPAEHSVFGPPAWLRG